MKSVFFLLIAVFVAQMLPAQKIELSAGLYSGLSSFGGQDATTNSPMVTNPYTSPQNSTRRPYGKKAGAAFGVEAKISLVTPVKIFISASGSFERSSSSVDIDSVYQYGIVLNYYAASGKTKHSATYFNFFPQLGYRISLPLVKIDLSAGLVMAHCTRSSEKGHAVYNGTTEVNSDAPTFHPQVDIRPAAEAAVHIRKFAFTAGYQWGIRNYFDNYLGGRQPEAFSRLLKIGVLYRLR